MSLMTAITTAPDAERAIDDLTALIEKLSELVAHETALVHAGKVSRCRRDSVRPSRNWRTSSTQRASGLKVNAKFLLQSAPARCAALCSVQEAFRAVLQKNLIVLATTHAVSEGIMRRLSGDLARKAAPQVYGATGRATPPTAKYGQPLAVSKKL